MLPLYNIFSYITNIYFFKKKNNSKNYMNKTDPNKIKQNGILGIGITTDHG
jgi:hypothetical protein